MAKVAKNVVRYPFQVQRLNSIVIDHHQSQGVFLSTRVRLAPVFLLRFFSHASSSSSSLIPHRIVMREQLKIRAI